MGHLGDHTAGRRRIDEFGDAADLVELETDQGFALGVNPSRCAAGLPDFDGFSRVLVGVHGMLHPQSAGASASTSRRRACNVETLTLRRAATERGESCRLSASKVARTTL